MCMLLLVEVHQYKTNHVIDNKIMEQFLMFISKKKKKPPVAVFYKATFRNTIILFVCPPKFYISILKLETMLNLQNLGGQTILWYFQTWPIVFYVKTQLSSTSCFIHTRKWVNGQYISIHTCSIGESRECVQHEPMAAF